MGADTVYIPRDDETEARRLVDTNGVGDVILDEEQVREYHLTDFGMGTPYDDVGLPR